MGNEEELQSTVEVELARRILRGGHRPQLVTSRQSDRVPAAGRRLHRLARAQPHRSGLDGHHRDRGHRPSHVVAGLDARRVRGRHRHRRRVWTQGVPAQRGRPAGGSDHRARDPFRRHPRRGRPGPITRRSPDRVREPGPGVVDERGRDAADGAHALRCVDVSLLVQHACMDATLVAADIQWTRL